MWKEPLKWNKAAEKEGVRKRVFCASFADVFEDWTGLIADSNGDTVFVREGKWTTHADPDTDKPLTMQDVRKRLFDLFDATPYLDKLLLTKRPENIWPMVDALNLGIGEGTFADRFPNVWLGTSVENQATKHRIDELRKIPAKVRFLSCEPLLEDLGTLDLTGINWVIVGGESGTDARPCNIDWIRSIVRQCQAANVPPFVKQVGSRPVKSRDIVLNEGERIGDVVPLKLKDSKGGNPEEWAEDLRVREFPQVGAE